MEEMLERQLLIRGRAFAALTTIEKALSRAASEPWTVCCAGLLHTKRR